MKKIISLGCISLLSFLSFGQASLTLDPSAAQTIRLYTPGPGLENQYWASDISGPGSDMVGLVTSSSSDPTRARYNFMHAGILNSQISSIKLKITFSAQNMYLGWASVRASMNNNACNVSLPWNLTLSGGISSDQHYVYDCVNLNAITPGGPDVASNSLFSSTQEYTMYTRSTNATTNLQYVDPGSDNFTFNLTEIQGSIEISSIQAIIVYDVPAVSAPSITAAMWAPGNRINVSWSAVPNATQYQVYTATGTTPIQTVTGTSCLFQNLAGCTTYSYRVKAVNAAGALSNFSNISSATTAYSDIVVTSATATTNQINLSWNPVFNAGSYSVTLLGSGGGTIATFPGNQTSGSIPAVPGAKYDMQMSTQGTCGSNWTSIMVRTPFVAPTLSGSPTYSTSAKIICNNIQPRATSIQLIESATGNVVQTYQIPTPGSIGQYVFQVNGLQPLTNYSYYARLIDGSWNSNTSPNSNTYSVTTRFADPPVITDVYSSAIAPVLTPVWTAVPNAVSYELVELTSPPAVLLTTTTQTSYVHSGLGYGTLHWYSVRAKDASNNYTAYSNSFSRQTISEYNPPKGLMVLGAGTLEAYPNPTSSELKISGGEDLVEGYVYTASGQLIKTVDLRASSILDVSELQPGTYFLKVIDLNKEHELLFVKE